MDRIRIVSIVSAAAALATVSAVSAQENASFEKVVFPIIQEKCVECHRAPYEKTGRIRKPKAELRFDAAWGFVKGGETGAVVVPGKPEESPMFLRVTLPEDHTDFMPPMGDGLTAEEKEILKKWIAEGADFGGWKGSEEARPADAKDAFEK